VLKVGHHGSNTSSTKSFLDIATPEYAAISVGEGNSYGHPSNTVIDRLESVGAEVFRTDYMGDIVFNIENERIVRPQ
jgi:competence protein ComEC